MSFPEALSAPYVRQDGEHERLRWLGGTRLTMLLDAAVTGGPLSVMLTSATRGDASPVHVHNHEDEALIVLKGLMTVWVGEQRHHLTDGAVGFLPRGIPHALRYDADTEAMIISTPGGQEQFFRAAVWDLSAPAPEGWAISPEVLQEAAARYGTTIVGPPHGIDD
jgi:quercetin dioxygenase-like cupin family protein